MVVRVLSPHDALSVQDLRRLALLEASASDAYVHVKGIDSPLDRFIACLGDAERGAVLGVTKANELAGIVGLCWDPFDGRRAHLWGLYIKASYRRAAISKQLLRGAIQFARAKAELTRLDLSVSDSNAAALTLYRSYGFAEISYENDPFALDDTGTIEMCLCLRQSTIVCKYV